MGCTSSQEKQSAAPGHHRRRSIRQYNGCSKHSWRKFSYSEYYFENNQPRPSCVSVQTEYSVITPSMSGASTDDDDDESTTTVAAGEEEERAVDGVEVTLQDTTASCYSLWHQRGKASNKAQDVSKGVVGEGDLTCVSKQTIS